MEYKGLTNRLFKEYQMTKDIPEMPDEVIKNSLRQIEEAQASLKNRKIEFENERKEDKERGIERSVIMLAYETYQIYRTSKTLKEATEKYKEALEKKGEARIELALEGTELLNTVGFNWDEGLSEHMLNHLAMMEYTAFRAGFFNSMGRFDTWLKSISEEKLIEAQKKAKEEKFEDIRL